MYILTHPGDYVLAIKPDGAKVRVSKDMVAHIPKIWAVPSVRSGFFYDRQYYRFDGLLKEKYWALPRTMSVKDFLCPA